MNLSDLWHDVAGEVAVATSATYADFFTRNEVAIVVEQDLGRGARVVGWVSLSRALLEDLSPRHLDGLVASHLEPIFRPWAFADPNPFPLVDTFPRAAAVSRLFHRIAIRGRGRLRL